MKKAWFVTILIILSSSVFAQTDYFFVLERPTAQDDTVVSVYQTLAAALITDNDTISIVSYGETGGASFLFSPLPGNTPDLIRLSSQRLSAIPLRGAVHASAISSAITLADEQAAAWGRFDAEQKLIIITGSPSAGRGVNITAPGAFSGIYYLSINTASEPEIADIAGAGFYWAVHTDPTFQSPDFISLADGIFACINAIVPRQYIKASVHDDFISFSAGNLLWQIDRAVVLTANTTGDQANILKADEIISDLSVFSQSAYSVLHMETVSSGTYTVENGEIVLVLVQRELSFVVFAVLAAIAAGVVIVILIAVSAAAVGMKKRTAPVFSVSYEINDSSAGNRKAEICRVKNRKNAGSFESGDTLKSIINYMRIEDSKLNAKTVSESYPVIVWDKQKASWFIRYNPNAAVGQAHEETNSASDDDFFDPLGDNSQSSGQYSQSEYTNEEESFPSEDPIQGDRFIVKRIFKNNDENKLVITKIRRK